MALVIRMTDKEYVKNGGVTCPFCRADSSRLDWGSLDNSDEYTATQEVSCESCGSNWADVYKLQGYEG